MKIYKIPTEWCVCSVAEIEANSLEEAIKLVEDKKYDTTKENTVSTYIEDSWKIQYDFIEDNK